MKNNLKFASIFILAASLFIGCQKDDYSLGDLSAPTNLTIGAEVVGQDASNPNGDGSGNVNVTVAADNAMTYKIGYNDITDLTTPVVFSSIPSGVVTKKFTSVGLHTYRITVIAYGRGGSSTTSTLDVQVVSNFAPTPEIVTALTNDASKTWVVDKNTAGHFGVGPWLGEVTPIWYAAAPNEKEVCCHCFYSATFTFTKVTASNSFTLQVTAPDGAFTKTGSLAGGLPGIPASGDEGCYNGYTGGTSAFSFVPSSSGVAASAPSTQTGILLAGNNTYIGYGAQLKEYEIMVITPTYMYLRVQGTETGNAWYLKLIPAP
ncbi:MAG: hypothetical protein ABIQ27_09140 [Flavobacterium sp.]|uniref:hypothetical protein n=1 Tax=Flavobacterium sp. TaxID=239 RepID=UPI003266322F